MLKRFSFLGLVGAGLVAVVGCDNQSTQSQEPTAAATTAAAPKAPTVEVGAEVVAATSKTSFREGKVVSIEGSKLTFEYGSPDEKTGKKSTWTVDKDKVWLMGQVKEAAAGDNIVCRTGTESWYPCQVKSVEGTVIKVEDSYGKEHNLELGALLKPDAATQADIKDYLIREGKRREFDAAFEAAGKPIRPDKWAPKKGDKVVIHFVGTSWYGGSVVELKKDQNQVRIDWEGDTWSDQDKSIDDVAPQPKDKQSVKEGQFVIARPSSATMRWEHCKIVSITGDAAEVIDRDGNKRNVNLKDVVPILP
jgi:hypothetical protein